MVYGYARCSTNEEKQDLKRQTRELEKAGAQALFVEYEHGDAKIKQQLNLLLEQAQQGDEIIVLEVSRLARSTKQLCDIIETIRDKKLKLNILGSITVDCTSGTLDPMTNAFLQMSGVFAELELMIIRDRVKSGLANKRAQGVKLGRPELTKDDLPAIFFKYYPEYKSGKMNVSEFARVCDISRPTRYRYLSTVEK